MGWEGEDVGQTWTEASEGVGTPLGTSWPTSVSSRQGSQEPKVSPSSRACLPHPVHLPWCSSYEQGDS